MALKTILDNLDGVEDALKGLYEEKDGKFILQLEGIDNHPAVVSLKNGHTNSKRERDEARTEVTNLKKKFKDVPEDFDAAEWERLRTEEAARIDDPDNKDVRKQVETATNAVKLRYENQITALKKAHDDVVAEKDGTISELEGDIRRTLVEDGLVKSLVKVGCKPTLMKAAQRLFEGDVEIVVEDGKRVARMKTDLGGDDVEKFIANWAQSDDAKDFIVPLKGGDENGSGSRRSGGPNPFTKKEWNITQQGQLSRTDRPKAEALAKAAGFKDLDEANRSIGPKQTA